MPRYVKDGRVIFASNLAYEAIYQEQGFLPMEDEKRAEEEENKAPVGENEDNKLEDIEEEENKAPVGENEDNKLEDIEEEDDYGDEEGDIDPNENMPLVARVGMLSYEALKEKAKELGIPKYANIKREELQAKVVEALEKENAER